MTDPVVPPTITNISLHSIFFWLLVQEFNEVPPSWCKVIFHKDFDSFKSMSKKVYIIMWLQSTLMHAFNCLFVYLEG